jgi:hypothetical protein
LDEPDESDVPDEPESFDELEDPESVELEPDPVLDSDDPDVAPSPDDLELEDDLEPLELPRSFLAQPDPLKWIVGGANSLRIVPASPHEGQKSGPGSFRPCRMSVRWSQAVQAYS